MSSHGKAEITAGNRAGDADDSLESAIAHTGRNACTTGEESFELRRAAAIAQRDALFEWAESRGLMLSPSLWEGRTVIGGSEHDIWEEAGEIWKVTRPDRFGWTVLPGDDGFPTGSEATPLEYLERWANAVRYFGDQIRIRGVAKTEQGVQVVVSQAYIEGVYPRHEEIIHAMTDSGFTLVPRFSIGAEENTSFYHIADRVAVFDAAGDNFILSGGVPIPVDVVTLLPGDQLHRQLLALIFGR